MTATERIGHWAAILTVVTGFSLCFWLVWPDPIMCSFNGFLAGMLFSYLRNPR